MKGGEPDIEGAAGRPASRHAAFAAAGALAIGLQVALLRDLMVALGGDEGAVGIGLAAWLAGVAIGAVVARRFAGSRPGAWASAGIVLLAMGGPVLLVAMRLLRFALAPPPGELLALGSSFLLALATLLPAGLLVGASFTALAAAAAEAGVAPGRSIAALYVFESLGSLAAGLAVTFAIVPYFVPLRGVTLLSGASLLLAVPASLRGERGERAFLPGRGTIAAVAVLLLAASITRALLPVEAATARARFAGMAPGIPLLESVDTPYQNVAVGGGEVKHLYLSGQYAGSFPDPVTSEGLANVIATLSPRPARVLAIGGGVLLGPLRFLLRQPVERIDVPEPDVRALDLLRRLLPPEDLLAMGDHRVAIVHDDPRRFLARAGERYDLIAVLEPDPITLLLARLTTVEFYRLCATHIAEDGVLVLTLRTAPNVITGETAALAGSIRGALSEVFPVVRIGPGPDGLLVAGFDPQAATLDPDVLAARWRARKIEAAAFAPEMFGEIFPPERVAAQEAAIEVASRSAPPSRDGRPVSFLHALARRQTITGGAPGRALTAVSARPPAVVGALALLPSLITLVIVARRRARRAEALRLAAVHAIAATGACGMVWALILLFSWQAYAGALYGQIGILTALFMLGLALGGAAASRGEEAIAPVARRRLLRACTVAFAFAAILGARLTLGGMIAPGSFLLGAALHGTYLLLAGVATGYTFPIAASAWIASDATTAQAAGAIESADHAGAAAAALLAAVLFIPLFGLAPTALLLTTLQALSLAITTLVSPLPKGGLVP